MDVRCVVLLWSSFLGYSRDVRSFCFCLVMLAVLSGCKKSDLTEPSERNSSPQPAAPGAQGAQDVWRGLRWDMPMDRASQTLSRQGLEVREQGPRKSRMTWLSTEVDGWHATVYFDEGRMNQITVIAETLTKEAASAAKERLTRRFGAVKDTSFRAERMWGQRLGANGPWTKLFVARIPDEGRSEERRVGKEWRARW